MADGVSPNEGGLVRAVEVARETALQQAPNGLSFASFGANSLSAAELERIVQAVPIAIAHALTRKAYFFVPLTMAGSRELPGDEVMISPVYTTELSDQAICHRNVPLSGVDGVFISTRLLGDRFALAFEFFINVGHGFVDTVGVPEAFNTLLWEQALKDVRGETSQDAWESRRHSFVQAAIGANAAPRQHIDERAKSEFLEAAFADAIAIYLLSLTIDFNYSELREREYPLLAPEALAERLRLANKLFPANAGYEFAIRYRRRA